MPWGCCGGDPPASTEGPGLTGLGHLCPGRSRSGNEIVRSALAPAASTASERIAGLGDQTGGNAGGEGTTLAP
jgi:hypothetical protein